MGQMFCVFYSLLGIPLTIIFLQSVSNALLQTLSEFEKYLQNMEMKETQIRTCEVLFFLVTGLSIFILLPPLLFMKMEGWTYEEGLYFAFISLSTIGFGDYIIGLVIYVFMTAIYLYEEVQLKEHKHCNQKGNVFLNFIWNNGKDQFSQNGFSFYPRLAIVL
ncbi:hypothetical protein MJG53_008532 [Ovis ammon polii x Ovis aries]|uniref:Potassium channel domain-containing protein n=2 Tax=Ovis TaxID=9935 RepID=A0A836A3J8_SHEEP|nr:hypothetical protein JEQ12_018331 [Ovis aries]KAI4583319.1 hypothetical protein MJG53_008532 [Ovis ammon polii x Ovis aries]